jgi:hypothetical protein
MVADLSSILILTILGLMFKPMSLSISLILVAAIIIFSFDLSKAAKFYINNFIK